MTDQIANASVEGEYVRWYLHDTFPSVAPKKTFDAIESAQVTKTASMNVICITVAKLGLSRPLHFSDR